MKIYTEPEPKRQTKETVLWSCCGRMWCFERDGEEDLNGFFNLRTRISLQNSFSLCLFFFSGNSIFVEVHLLATETISQNRATIVPGNRFNPSSVYRLFFRFRSLRAPYLLGRPPVEAPSAPNATHRSILDVILKSTPFPGARLFPNKF